MTKTSSAVKRRYNEKAYDRLAITVPKGQKQAIENFAALTGDSINGLINRLLRVEMGLSAQEWKNAGAKQENKSEISTHIKLPPVE